MASFCLRPMGVTKHAILRPRIYDFDQTFAAMNPGMKAAVPLRYCDLYRPNKTRPIANLRLQVGMDAIPLGWPVYNSFRISNPIRKPPPVAGAQVASLQFMLSTRLSDSSPLPISLIRPLPTSKLDANACFEILLHPLSRSGGASSHFQLYLLQQKRLRGTL